MRKYKYLEYCESCLYCNQRTSPSRCDFCHISHGTNGCRPGSPYPTKFVAKELASERPDMSENNILHVCETCISKHKLFIEEKDKGYSSKRVCDLCRKYNMSSSIEETYLIRLGAINELLTEIDP